MPTYQYRCDNCDLITEARLPIERRDELDTCACGGLLTRMLASLARTWGPTRKQ